MLFSWPLLEVAHWILHEVMNDEVMATLLSSLDQRQFSVMEAMWPVSIFVARKFQTCISSDQQSLCRRRYNWSASAITLPGGKEQRVLGCSICCGDSLDKIPSGWEQGVCCNVDGYLPNDAVADSFV